MYTLLTQSMRENTILAFTLVLIKSHAPKVRGLPLADCENTSGRLRLKLGYDSVLLHSFNS